MSRLFAREPFTPALFGEMGPLLEAHWREIAHYLDIPLSVDAEVYFGAQERGALRVYTAREPWTMPGEPFRVSASPLVGYAVFFVRPNPHYSGSVQAVQDVVYVSPDARGTTGARLIAFADDQLRQEGVQAVYHHVKVAHNWGRMLERMGYEAVDVIYAKRLDQPPAAHVARFVGDDTVTSETR